MKGIVLMILSITLQGCEEPRYQRKPYQAFSQVGLLGHGEGILGDLQLNYYGVQRRCDSCHTDAPKAHPPLGACNSCHQPHQRGWSHSMVALDHAEVLPLEGHPHHFQLKCKDCHDQLESRTTYRETKCIHCHNHSRKDVIYAHELLENFDIHKEYSDVRCLACHVKTGLEYAHFYDPMTGEPK